MGEVILKDGRKMVLRKGNNVCHECHGTGQVSGRSSGRDFHGNPLMSWRNPWLKEVIVRSFICMTCGHFYFSHAYLEDDYQAETPCGHILAQRNLEETEPFDPKKLSDAKLKGKIPKTKWTRGR